MSSSDRQYFLAKVIKISLNVNVLFYSFETVIFILKQIQDNFSIPSFFQRVYLAVVQTSSSYMCNLPNTKQSCDVYRFSINFQVTITFFAI